MDIIVTEKEDNRLAIKYFKPSESGANISLDFSKLSDKEKEEFKKLTLNLENYATKDMVNKKVDQIPNKGLSTNDYTNEDKEKVNSIPTNPIYTDTTYSAGTGLELVGNTFNIDNTIARREDIPDGADLSEYVKKDYLAQQLANNYTDEDKLKVDNIPDNPKYTDTQYEAGSGLTLSNNTFSIDDTVARKSDIPNIDTALGKIDLSSYATTESVNEKLTNKVDKVQGKQLSTNDYTNTDKIKVNNIPTTGAKYTDTTYSAGNGIMLSGNKFSVDDTIARKIDLDNITLSDEQVARLKGEPGKKGEKGDPGPRGLPGRDGSDATVNMLQLKRELFNPTGDNKLITIAGFDIDFYDFNSTIKISNIKTNKKLYLDFQRKESFWAG